jgi:hypothetical protein
MDQALVEHTRLFRARRSVHKYAERLKSPKTPLQKFVRFWRKGRSNRGMRQTLLVQKHNLRERNYQNCLYGHWPCDSSKLTSTERVAVASAVLERNYRNCLGGWLCDRGKPTRSQREAVEFADQNRNYHNFLILGVGGLCNASKLTAEQRAAVEVADRHRNYYNCVTYGFGWLCNKGRLNSEQRSVVQSTQRYRQIRSAPLSTGQFLVIRAPQQGASTSSPSSSPNKSTVSASITGVRVCAENGSCYGDLSEFAGRPKTVYVRSYYRRDGYIRQKPLPKHPKALAKRRHCRLQCLDTDNPVRL